MVTGPAKRPPMSEAMYLRLPTELAARLDREACRIGHSEPDIVRVAVEQMLDRQDAHRTQEAAHR